MFPFNFTDDIAYLSSPGGRQGQRDMEWEDDERQTDSLIAERWSSATLKVLSSMPSRTIGESCWRPWKHWCRDDATYRDIIIKWLHSSHPFMELIQWTVDTLWLNSMNKSYKQDSWTLNEGCKRWYWFFCTVVFHVRDMLSLYVKRTFVHLWIVDVLKSFCSSEVMWVTQVSCITDNQV